MSTGQRPQDSSQSALFYLVQEVSKLSSPTHNVTNSNSVRLNENSRQDDCIHKKDKDRAFSFQTCHNTLSLMSAYGHSKSEKDDSPSSTWKVLSLINMQCERLMHQRDEDDTVSSSVSSTTNSPKGQPTAKLLTPDVTEQDVRSDHVRSECTLKSSVLRHKSQEVTASVEDAREDCSQSESKHRPECFKEGCSFQSQPAKKPDAVIPKLVEGNAAASSESQHGDKKEIKFIVTGELVWNQQCREQDIFSVPLAKNSCASQISQLTFNSNEAAGVSLSKPTITLDYNANVTLPTELPYDMQLPPSTDSHSPPKQENGITGPECIHSSADKISPPAAQLNSYESCTTSKLDPMEVQMEGILSPSIQQWRTKTPRKQPHPSRSIDIQDPDLQGVTFRMDTEVDDNKDCRLLITSKYSKELCKNVRKPKLRTRASQKPIKTSSSEEESDLMTNISKDKVCASCCTRKTPMWRDAEDGTPLCNACGIRYKKYRVRCVNCWHIPKKEGTSNSCCLKCGKFVRMASTQRKHTS